MKKNIKYLLIFFLFSSCSKDYLFNKNQIVISNELKNIINADQSARNYKTLINIKYKIRDFNYVCDSLYKSGARGNLNKVYDFSKLPTKEVQIAKLSKKDIDNYYNELESGEKFMTYIDDLNKNKIYQITKKFGYPSYDNRNWIDTTSVRVGITVILTHIDSNSEVGKKMLKLMIKEYFNGRVSNDEMRHYMWHTDGRVESGPSKYSLDKTNLKKRYKSL